MVVVLDKTIVFSVSNRLCEGCSVALKRFVGGIDGVESLSIEGGSIAVRFDQERIDEESRSAITAESIEKLGYRLETKA